MLEVGRDADIRSKEAKLQSEKVMREFRNKL